ncbi:MAG: hypothetical protein AAF734_00495, partial [Bacteroidota bacterium]
SFLKFNEQYPFLKGVIERLWEDVSAKKIPLHILEEENLFFKLPEYGTTILACKSEQEVLKDPDAFWEDMQQNHPERIIKLAWSVEKGKFYIQE